MTYGTSSAPTAARSRRTCRPPRRNRPGAPWGRHRTNQGTRGFAGPPEFLAARRRRHRAHRSHHVIYVSVGIRPGQSDEQEGNRVGPRSLPDCGGLHHRWSKTRPRRPPHPRRRRCRRSRPAPRRTNIRRCSRRQARSLPARTPSTGSGRRSRSPCRPMPVTGPEPSGPRTVGRRPGHRDRPARHRPQRSGSGRLRATAEPGLGDAGASAALIQNPLFRRLCPVR